MKHLVSPLGTQSRSDGFPQRIQSFLTDGFKTRKVRLKPDTTRGFEAASTYLTTAGLVQWIPKTLYGRSAAAVKY